MRLTGLLAAALAGVALCFSTAFAKELQVGFVYVSPVGDAGWSYAHDQARQKIEEMDGVKTSFVEAVAEGPDSERVMLNMARKGFDLIFATSFGYMDPMLKVAQQFPKTVFMHCSGFKTAENMGNYFGRMYQARYLSGMVAGAMTTSNTLGYVAAFPIPEVIRGINAFTLGAQAMNPEVTVRVVWTKTWYDPATEKEAAKSLLDVGADVIAQHQDSPGPQEAAQEKGVYSIGYNSDMTQFAPKAHLTAPIWNWAPFYEETVKQVQEGVWKSASVWPGLKEGIVDLAPISEMVPQAVRDQIMAKKEAIIGGEEVFMGPLKDQNGVEKVAAGVAMSDEEMLGMTWFVQGVVGTTE
ncbi:BMP family ABC transporter substrate-binding protein [Desulfofustis limnaeus]|jgi:basic membrane protein A|uniref:BMP family ABC transporter substrate-binding protein n=1 Tax=Desulfofustis limnaeus TaxID=2740163 RepID=A0ABN6M7G8_9BACT|nr:BMP family ABC transporter substrate-binding protein [Desulfofustis limnaeus]MDX9895175.1 BMP family ABC transporter substrate-binding protein [Desulfofustis sp.]BDD88777.1 BMP family ABC transporter substrate-binding protein [Desulfofustis limnaeus]